MGQKAVPEPAVLIGGLGRRGGGEDDPTSAAKLSQARFGGQKAARLRIDVQNLRPNAAGKTTVEEQDQALCRYPREPFLQQLERDRGAGEIIWIRVVGDELMCLRPMAGERDHHRILGAAAGQVGKCVLNPLPRGLRICQQDCAAAQRVEEQCLQRRRVATRAGQLINAGRAITVDADEQAAKRHEAPRYARTTPTENAARGFSAFSSTTGANVSFRATC